MANPAKFLFFAVALGVAYSLGSCGEHVEVKTETRFVKVPVVKTHVEYKDKMLPYPESCTEALAAAERITANDAEQTKAVGEILLALQDLGSAAAFDDVAKINETTEIVRKEGGTLNDTVLERNTAINTFETYLLKCQQEIADHS